MSDFDRLINASDLTEWIVESFPDWCEGDVRSILDHVYEMPTHTTPSSTLDISGCVDRQAAIDAVDKRFDGIPMEQTQEILLLRRDLRTLPSVQPERKKGKWIYGEHDVTMCDGYRCDKCDFFVPWDYQHKSIDFIKDYNYCPSCGADMRGEHDG